MTKSKQHHNVYVIELDLDVLNDKKFLEQNPNFNSNMTPLYVGMTGIKPEERFENHKRGYKASKYPKKFGLRLLTELYEILNPMSYEDAANMEKQLADELRAKGHPVWQK